MQTVSLFVEFIRTRPQLVFWLAALTQAALWTLVPALFYAAPPGELAELMAISHRFKLGTDFGPPLAYWAAELAFQAAGRHLFGVYLLSQVCIVVAFWAVFRLATAIAGARHAAVATLLMAAVVTFTVPSPDFGPAILAMPLWALALLHYWRAVGEERPRYWFALALDIGLLLLTTYMGLALVIMLAIFTGVTARGRASIVRIEPMLAGLLVVVLLFPHLMWIDQASSLIGSRLLSAGTLMDADRGPAAWAWFLGVMIAGYAGAGILIALAMNLLRLARGEAVAITRVPVDPFAASFVYALVLGPFLIVTGFGVIFGQIPPRLSNPLLILSGLAIIVAAGDVIRLHNQRLVGWVWSALFLVPPAIAAAAVVVLPWTLGIDLRVAKPANEIARFFTESFERRTGRPFRIVGGDPYLASVVALASPQRPGIHRDSPAVRNIWVSDEDLRQHGAVIVWPATDTAGTPPPAIRAKFPDLVPEIPSVFRRTFQGRLPLLRIGWGVIRPQQASSSAAQ